MIELRGISKYFPSNGVTALRNAGITLHPGEIHALLGENGTGKSTLMHIFAGYLAPSSGVILVDGKERRFSAPAGALALGIGMVRQHPGFIRGFKVWEDCILGTERVKLSRRETSAFPEKRGAFFAGKRRGIFFDSREARKRVRELSERWNFDLPLDGDTESLTVNQRQKAAVLSLLLRNVKWFIFDEPTAVLTPGETQTLFELFGRLKSEGRGIVLITHKLDEALRVSDRITVIRRGITLEPVKAGELSVDALKKSIFGGGVISPESERPAPLPRENFVPSGGSPVLAINKLAVEAPGLPYIRNVNLTLRPGRILGIAGVRDSGLETLELAIAGLLSRPGKTEGSVVLNGRDITGKGVRVFREAGGAYLGADRLGSNLAPELPLRESLIIHAFRRARRGRLGFLDTAYLDSRCRNIMKRAGLVFSRISDRADSFSGGMLQRVLLAREFAEDASLVILAEAGSGLDAAKRSGLEKELKKLARGGRSALLFSTDVEELLSVADEIMVLRGGTFAARFILKPADPRTENPDGETILSAAEARERINSAMTETGTASRVSPGGVWL